MNPRPDKYIDTEGSEDLGPELDFLREVWALDHALQKASKRMKRVIGLTGPQRLALRLVGRFPGLPAGRLARLMHLHASTVTGILQRLATRGLLEKGAAAADRRRVVLRLTRDGLEMLARPHPTIESTIAAALAERPSGERKATLVVLRTLTSRLDSPGVDPR